MQLELSTQCKSIPGRDGYAVSNLLLGFPDKTSGVSTSYIALYRDITLCVFPAYLPQACDRIDIGNFSDRNVIASRRTNQQVLYRLDIFTIGLGKPGGNTEYLFTLENFAYFFTGYSVLDCMLYLGVGTIPSVFGNLAPVGA